MITRGLSEIIVLAVMSNKGSCRLLNNPLDFQTPNFYAGIFGGGAFKKPFYPKIDVEPNSEVGQDHFAPYASRNGKLRSFGCHCQ